MQRFRLSTFIIVIALVLFSACNRIPDHARYIPKDAVAVAGVNLSALSKKIAWNVITGSKLFKEMQARIPEKNAKDAVSGIEKAGLDFSNTFYLYVKTDNRFKGGNKVTGLIPLSDAGQWEAYVKMAFPAVQVKQHGDRKEASLGNDMYVSWTGKLLIVINMMPVPVNSQEVGEDGKPVIQPLPVLDEATVSAEMDNAFSVTKENSIVGNKHYAELEKAGHDVTFWVNYEQLMNQMSSSIAESMSMSLSSALWKDAAFASGFDFGKGKITGDMLYYLSPEMKDFGVAFGSTNADNDMVSRLPKQNLDMIAAMHVSPKALKIMLEKMNMLGLANLGLAIYGLSADNILDAFSGDMAFVMNDFSLHVESVTDTFMGQPIVRKNEKPDVAMSYIMKINSKDDFQKIQKMVKEFGMQTISNGYVIPLTARDSVYIMINDKYVIASNRFANADGFLKGNFQSQKMAEPISSKISGHPWSIYLDVQQLCKNIDAGMANTPNDSMMISESKKLLNNISLTGGEFKNTAFEYHMEVVFMNTDENSIIELMDYGMKMSEAAKSR